jgi:hypothetical protein
MILPNPPVPFEPFVLPLLNPSSFLVTISEIFFATSYELTTGTPVAG